MAASPIRISVEVEGIEPNARFQAALDELVAAAGELVEASGEVAGYLADDELPSLRGGVWTDMRPGVKGFNIGIRPGPTRWDWGPMDKDR